MDSISLWLVLLTTLLMPLAILSSFNSIKERQTSYYAWMQLLLAAMVGVYAIVVPHEERYLTETFGEPYAEYTARVPRVLPGLEPSEPQYGSYDPAVIGKAESRTFLTFGAMLAVLALKALKA